MLSTEASATLVPVWPIGDGAEPHVWRADDEEVCAFHWAPLTSGSRWFALWPLLLPFTLVNVAGFMHPDTSLGRLATRVHGVLCAVMTAWVGAWLALAGQLLVTDRDAPTYVGVAGSMAFVGLLLLATTIGDQRAPRQSERVQRRSGLDHADFFLTGRGWWGLHAAVLVATTGWCGWALRGEPGSGARVAPDAERLVVALGIAIVGLLIAVALLLVLDFIVAPSGQRGSTAWALGSVGTAGLGVAMGGALIITLLRTAVADDRLLSGPAFLLYDVYGLALLVGLFVAVAVAVRTMIRKSAGELVADEGDAYLPNPASWFRARVSRLPRALISGLGAAAVAFLLIGTHQFLRRAPATYDGLRRHVGDRLLGGTSTTTAAETCREYGWVITATPPVRIASAAILGIFGFTFVKLIRARASTEARRQVGNVWDVLGFWPRRNHPFAVRPYTALAVPQLRELLAPPEGTDGWCDGALNVVAHSQGSVVAAAALASMPAGGSHVTHLVTCGSPIGALYAKAFPRYFDTRFLERVIDALPGTRWTNVFRFTDHVGRSIFCDERSWPGDAPLDPRFNGRFADIAIADPRERQGRIDGHNDYWIDPRVEEIVRAT